MNVHKLVKSLMEEYNIDLDDIRWYLSDSIARRIISMEKLPEELTRYIWSGKLDSDIFNMEERYIMELEDLLERNLIDESAIREYFAEISALKCARF